MTRKPASIQPPLSGRRSKRSTSEKEFLREVKKNMQVDAKDDLAGPKAMAERASRGGKPPRR